MYSSKSKIFFSIIILGAIVATSAIIFLPKLKDKNKDKSQSLALVDLASLDSDSDGLSDKKEQELGTNLYNSDTDGDGYSDLEEVKSGHDPLKIESYNLIDEDGDGLTLEEEEKYGTNPKNPDTDYDGYSDGLEIAAGYDPLVTNLSFLKNLAAKEENKDENSVLLSSKVSAAENTLSAATPADLEKNLTEFLGSKENQSQQGNFLNFSPEKIETSELKIKGEANKEIVQAYVNSLGILAFKSLPFSVLDQQEIQNYILNFDPNNSSLLKDNIKILEDTFISLKNLEVPNDEEIILWHKKLLSFLLNIKSLANGWQENKNDLYGLVDILEQSKNLADYGTGELFPQLQKISQKYNVQLPDNIDFYKQFSR
ncbi:MAG: hypothetical protein AB1465_02545 [Patescibacteria group bacterium]